MIDVELRHLENAANQGYVDAQYKLGLKYALGKDEKQAFAWYEKAANQGHADAQFQLGRMYAEGRGVAQDEKQALVWYEKAAMQGNWEAKYKIELSHYEKAANQGDADAQYNLGLKKYHVYGYGADALDRKKACEWFEKAANQGHKKAQYELGWMYEHGLEIVKDEKQAIAWYEKAAMQGHAKAQFQLGKMYAEGRGVATDEKQAWVWYEKAADQGHADAQYNLARLYADGRGVAKDETQAWVWYEKAAGQGYNHAKAALDRMKWRFNLRKKQEAASTLPLLAWVTEGQLEETEKLLKQNPQLALAKGTVTDLADRTFDNITAFQYAVWSLDSELWEIILKYMTLQQAALQLHELQNDRQDILHKYGSHFDFDPLLIAYERFINSPLIASQILINDPDKLDEEKMWCEAHWCEVIGAAQHKVPAWYIYAFCEQGSDVAWTTKDFTKPIKRQYEEDYMAQWFGKLLGDKAGYIRYIRSKAYDFSPNLNEFWHYEPYYRDVQLVVTDAYRRGELTDHLNTKLLKSRQLEQLAKLQDRLRDELTTSNTSTNSFALRR